MVASFQTGSVLTLVIPVALLVAVGLYWAWIARKRDEF
jgi:hypothetical protein